MIFTGKHFPMLMLVTIILPFYAPVYIDVN